MDTASLRPSTVFAITAGTVVTGFLAYAIYFDHRRRTDVEFRKTLKKESRAQAKAEREAKDAEAEKQKTSIREAVERANRDGYPDGELEREQFFMEQIQLAEEYQKDGESRCVSQKDSDF
jgi:mitochondrial import receptor subunit TOM20